MEFKRASEGIRKSLDMQTEVVEVYELVKDNLTIGYGTINKNPKNLISIYILEEYRGNGYGKVLFNKMIYEVKERGEEKINLTFSINNYIMKRIIEREKGLLISTDEKIVEYVINVNDRM